jgi:hypothetical protein
MTDTRTFAVLPKLDNREEARTHSADIIAIATAQGNPGQFRRDIAHQFSSDVVLGVRVLNIQRQYFAELTSPGFLVYEEFIVARRDLYGMRNSPSADELPAFTYCLNSIQ